MTRPKLISCSMSLAMAMLVVSSATVQPASAIDSKAPKHSNGKQGGNKQCGTRQCGTKLCNNKECSDKQGATKHAGTKQCASNQCGTKQGKNCDKKDGECKKDRKEMKVTLTKSGGIMGMMKTYELDSKTLTAENATKLSGLVDASNIVDLTSKTTPGSADLFFYEFKIEDGKRTTSVSFDDMSLPESVRPLLKFLMEYRPVEDKRSTEAT